MKTILELRELARTPIHMIRYTRSLETKLQEIEKIIHRQGIEW